jgi:hypothetical protein
LGICLQAQESRRSPEGYWTAQYPCRHLTGLGDPSDPFNDESGEVFHCLSRDDALMSSARSIRASRASCDMHGFRPPPE